LEISTAIPISFVGFVKAYYDSSLTPGCANTIDPINLPIKFFVCNKNSIKLADVRKTSLDFVLRIGSGVNGTLTMPKSDLLTMVHSNCSDCPTPNFKLLDN